MKHGIAVLLAMLLLSACSMMPADQGNLYELRREAQVAYDNSEDARAEKLLLGLAQQPAG